MAKSETGISKTLQDLILKYELDAIILYSTKSDSRLSLWGANIQCSSAFHYLIFSKEKFYFLEVSYRCSELEKRTSLQVIPFADEDLAPEFLRQHFQSAMRVGVAGEIPFYHLSQADFAIVDLQAEILEALEVKSAEALEGIRASVSVLCDSLNALKSFIHPGMSTAQIANHLERLLAEKNAIPAFSTSVVVGDDLKHSTIAIPSPSLIWQKDQPLLIDCGARLEGYCSDITRMFFADEYIGNLKPAYLALVRAQRSAASILNGTTSTISDLHEIMRQELTKNGLASETLEAQDLGHGIGYAVHEQPMFFRQETSARRFRTGNVITIEPEVVFEGYRLRVEDMFLIQADSCLHLTDIQ